MALLVYTDEASAMQSDTPRRYKEGIISKDNTIGSITKSNLKLAAEVLENGVIIGATPTIIRKYIGILCDKDAMVVYITKILSNSSPRIYGRLLQPIAIMMYKNHMGPLTTTNIQRENNLMYDITSLPKTSKQIFFSNSPHLNNY